MNKPQPLEFEHNRKANIVGALIPSEQGVLLKLMRRNRSLDRRRILDPDDAADEKCDYYQCDCSSDVEPTFHATQLFSLGLRELTGALGQMALNPTRDAFSSHSKRQGDF